MRVAILVVSMMSDNRCVYRIEISDSTPSSMASTFCRGWREQDCFDGSMANFDWCLEYLESFTIGQDYSCWTGAKTTPQAVTPPQDPLK